MTPDLNTPEGARNYLEQMVDEGQLFFDDETETPQTISDENALLIAKKIFLGECEVAGGVQ
jgi:hypothetical protein